MGGNERVAKYEAELAILRLVLGFAILVGLVSLLGWAFRGPLTSFGKGFVARFGVLGMIAGSYLADGFQFPLPPQFYLLTGIAGGHPTASVVAAVLLGSELGGMTSFGFGRLARTSPFVARRIAKPAKLLQDQFAKRGYLGLVIATLMPIPFSILCVASGALGFPKRAMGVLAVMRVPRILLAWVLIVVAWH